MRAPRVASLVAAALVLGVAAVPFALAVPDFPVPSPYPISWELDFTHGLPKRLAVDVPGSATPKGFWYMTYKVTNNGTKERMFFPEVELVTDDGKVHRADQHISKRVYDEIRGAERNPRLESFVTLDGPVRLGPAEAREGVVVWPETNLRMGHFSVFFAGLSGEAVTLKKGADGKFVKTTDSTDMKDPSALIVLHKTKQLNFFIRGDEVYPGEDEVNVDGEEWVMR
jgi:hypothetical protein